MISYVCIILCHVSSAAAREESRVYRSQEPSGRVTPEGTSFSGNGFGSGCFCVTCSCSRERNEVRFVRE